MPKSGEPKKTKVEKEDAKIKEVSDTTKKKHTTPKTKVTTKVENKTSKSSDFITEEAKKTDPAGKTKKAKEKTVETVNNKKTTAKKRAAQEKSQEKIGKNSEKAIDTKEENIIMTTTETEKTAEISTINKIEEKKSSIIEMPSISELENNSIISGATKAYSSLEKDKMEHALSSNSRKTNIFAEKIKLQTSGKKGFQTLEVVLLIVLTCIISLAVGGVLGIKFTEKHSIKENIEIADKEIQKFIKDYNYLVDNYYGEIDKKELLNTAFKSMVDALDDSYSGVLDESSSNNFDIELKGNYEGLGIEIINDEHLNIFIYSIIPNSPASKADIQAGDKLITVNGVNVTGMKTTDFINQIVKGSGETEFTIVLERNGENHTIVLKKEAITLESVNSKVYNENGKRIAYIKVNIFAENTDTQFQNELKKLEAEGFESLIIDLRDNSGGHLEAVQNMISLFLDSSHIIYQTEDKNGIEKVRSSGKITKKYPIVIVGNAMSASASEVMIGALTEEYGAILIGTKTFGKGTVQELHSLSNGDEYKFTTKKWLTPKGNWVHNEGIRPKVEVNLSKEYYENPIEENDNQLRTAINYLAGISE